MIKIDGDYYYIDLVSMDKGFEGDESLKAGIIEDTETTTETNGIGEVISTTTVVRKAHKPKEVDGFKYQTISLMLEIVLNDNIEYSDTTMKLSLDRASSSFAFAFNTLLKLQIIKKI